MSFVLKVTSLVALVLAWTATMQAACPAGWTAVDGRCFRTVFTNPNQCDALCISNGGRWATIHSKAQNDWFVAQGVAVNNNIWIGLNDQAVEGTYQWTNPGDSFTYSNWMPGQPMNDNTKQCVMMYRFSQPIGSWYWISNICDAGKIYCGCVTEDPATSKRPTVQPTAISAPPTVKPTTAMPTLTPTASPPTACPAGWVSNFGKCYLTTAPKKDYATCLSYCAGLGATLPCVMNTAENAYIASIYYNVDTTDDKCVYLGLNDIVTEGSFQWQTGCSSTMSNFSPGEPNDAHGGEDCTSVYTNGLTIWNDLRCNSVSYCVCEKAPSPIVLTATPTVIPTIMPTFAPSATPTTKPTTIPSANPTAAPTAVPTNTPTANPTESPTTNPTANPIASPTTNPTANPTIVPTATPSSTTAPTAGTCPSGWVSTLGKCYLPVMPRKTYASCLSHCAGLGATLPCVMNSAENEYLATTHHVIDGANQQYTVYLGLNNLADNSAYVWQPGCASTFWNFFHGQPDLPATEHCISIHQSFGQTTWGDLVCDIEAECVCEKATGGSRRLRGTSAGTV